MKIGGCLRFSLIDYPGKIAAVLFFQGCDFRCSFCHNPHLVEPKLFEKSISLEEVKSFLSSRKGEIEAVVFSGGEPTLQQELPSLIAEIKKEGFLIKLDTSGIHPEMLSLLLKNGLVDYVAMDLKAPLERYEEITRSPLAKEAIPRSINLLLSSSIPYEFRSTILPSLHQKEDLVAMAQMILGAKLWVLQSFRNKTTLSPSLKMAKGFTDEEMVSLQKMVSPFVQECQIR